MLVDIILFSIPWEGKQKEVAPAPSNICKLSSVENIPFSLVLNKIVLLVIYC